MWCWRWLWLAVLWCWCGWSVSGSADLRALFSETQRCVRSLWASSELIKDRFTLRQMAGLCQHRKDWLLKAKEYKRMRDHTAAKSLTPRQTTWLTHLRTCKTLRDCIVAAPALHSDNATLTRITHSVTATLSASHDPSFERGGCE